MDTDTYLYTFSLGPVQSLIVTGRRTRDLWCGSWLLSETAKAAALALYRFGESELIFPSASNLEEILQPQECYQESQANISNIIRAEVKVNSQSQLKALSDGLKKSASERLAFLCDCAKEQLRDLPLHEELWASQKNDILEYYAAWVKVNLGEYHQATNRLGKVLAARKFSRDFSPMANTKPGIPKSSLDGAYESVINLPRRKRLENSPYTPVLRKLGLKGGEELDVLGVAKRLAGDAEQFTPYARVVVDTWLQEQTEYREALCACYEGLFKADLATRVKGNSGIYSTFPYDGELLFKSRLETQLDTVQFAETQMRPLNALKDLLNKIESQPVPYGVMLHADGDKMGELFGAATNSDESREISRALNQFASSVRKTVQNFRGHAVFAGGDDVLAFLPLENAIACAEHLASDFSTTMTATIKALQGSNHAFKISNYPTLSVGLAIGHVMQPMQHLHNLAKNTEKVAKGDKDDQPRNALAICLDIRSGAAVTWRCRWDNKDQLSAMHTMVQIYRDGECPSRAGYDLRAIAERSKHWVTIDKATPLPGVHRSELNRLLDRTRIPGGEKKLSSEVKDFLINHAEQVGIEHMAKELIIARWLSARTLADIGDAI